MQGKFAFQNPPSCPDCGRTMTSLAGTDWFCFDHSRAADYFRNQFSQQANESEVVRMS